MMNNNVENVRLVKKPIAQLLSEKNALAIGLSLAEMQTKMFECLDVVARQQGTITMLLQRVAKLEQMEQLRKINMTGLGPSVKE